MKTLTTMIIALIFCITSPMTASAAEGDITPEQAFEMVLKGAEILKELGEEGLPAFIGPDSEMQLGHSSVTVADCSKKVIVAHRDPNLIGLPAEKVLCYKTGRQLINEFCSNVSEKGTWLEYWWPVGKDKVISHRFMFGIPVPGTPYVVSMGFPAGDRTLEDVRKLID